MKTQVLLGFFSFFLTSTLLAHPHFQLPKGSCSQIIEYTHYTLCYESEYRQASWVKYNLALDQINGRQKRTNNYRMDPFLEDPVTRDDYRGSGYDRGHLLPAAAMKGDYRSMSETFYMTNMSPQNPKFNRRIWAWMERHMRNLVKNYGEDAEVITAPILEQGLPRIASGVSVPVWYYKIIYFPKKRVMKAFLIENRPHEDVEVDDFIVTVDEIESLTGFDFFSDLPDWLESRLESQPFEE